MIVPAKVWMFDEKSLMVHQLWAYPVVDGFEVSFVN